MSRRIYAEVLKGNYKALGYYADEVVDSRSDFDFFHVIAIFIAPLIRRAPAFEWFFFRCMEEKDAYFRRRAELENAAPIEVEQAYRDLKQDLKVANLLNDSDIEQKIENIDRIFVQKASYGIPSYIEAIHQELCHLLEDTLRIAGVDLVKKYATVSHRNDQFYIDKFTFGKAIIELREMDAIWKNPCENLWVAWEYFALVEWCWTTPLSFFDDKQEDYSDYRSRNKSMQTLMLHNHWVQLHRIKEQVGGHEDITFNRTTYTACLKRIMNEVILQQEVSNGTLHTVVKDDLVMPYQVELRLDYTKLFLDVQWIEHGGPHIYLIHTFQDGKARLLFIKELVESSVGKKVVISSSHGSVAKYFDDSKLNNILGELFFERVNALSASKKHERIMGADLSIDQCRSLTDHIKNALTEMPRM